MDICPSIDPFKLISQGAESAIRLASKRVLVDFPWIFVYRPSAIEKGMEALLNVRSEYTRGLSVRR